MSVRLKNSSPTVRLPWTGKRASPLPFRLGMTSYVIPAGIIENVTALSGAADDIELVLFESSAESNLPGPGDIAELKRIAGRAHLTYTVHLPLNLQLGSTDETTRLGAVKECLRIFALTRSLKPFAWIMHFESGGGAKKQVRRNTDWKNALLRSVAEILSTGVDSRDLCVETLGYPFRDVEDIVFDMDLSVCLDVGHLVMAGYPLSEHIARYGDRVRVVHLHGVRSGKDHVDASNLDDSIMSCLFEWLGRDNRPARVVTLEVFNVKDVNRSLKALKEFSG